MLKIEKLSKADISHINKKFGGVVAIKDCSFEIKKGEIVGLIGSNGSGKTTLFNIISGIIRADSGKILIDNVDITNKSVEDIANFGLARSFQNVSIFPNLTVEENILLSMDNDDTNFLKNLFFKNKISEEKEKRVNELLELIDFKDIKDKLARDLSWGQKKLVDFLRTIAKPHKLLLLDEPASGIIPIYRQEKLARVMQAIKKENGTVLLIDHDIDFLLNVVDRVIVLNEGKIIAEGKPDEIRNNKEVLESYLGN